MKSVNSILVCGFLSISLSLCSSTSAQQLRTVFYSGDVAPGIPVSSSFSAFGSPAMNNVGQLAFSAWLQRGSNVTTANDYGMWTGSEDDLHLVAREGDQAPGTSNGVHFRDLRTPTLNDAGDIGFISRLTGTGVTTSNDDAMWTSVGGNLNVAAREGTSAPGTSNNRLYDQLFGPKIYAANQFAFAADLDNSYDGVWVQRGGPITLLVQTGDQSPGLSVGTKFSSLSGLAVDSSGEVAFRAFLQSNTGGITSKNNNTVWVERNGSLHLLAQEGSPAPRLADNIEFDYFGGVRRIAGRTAFEAGARVRDGSLVGNGIWVERNGSLTAVAFYGDQVPEAPGGVSFIQFDNAFCLNELGNVAFSAFLAGTDVNAPNQSGIFFDAGGNLRLVAREGGRAPGTSDDVLFGDLGSSAHYELNKAGQVLFSAHLVGDGITDGHIKNAPRGVPNDYGIWAQDRNGILHLIARLGDSIDVDNGPALDLRMIRSLNYYQGFNDLGQVAFSATFIDGTSGVFISNVATIPEPATFGLAILGIAGLMCNIARRHSRPA